MQVFFTFFIVLLLFSCSGTTFWDDVVNDSLPIESNPVLSSLAFSEGTLNPSFASGVYDYELCISGTLEQFDLTAKINLNDTEVTISEDGSQYRQIQSGIKITIQNNKNFIKIKITGS